MANSYFQFKQFTVHQDRCAMKVTTDGCLFGAWIANELQSQNSEAKTVLDIGTGTGLLSLMLAQKNINFDIDAIEIDKEAYQQAQENIGSSLFSKKITVLHGDAKEYQFTKKYDVIISNPPFYETELKGNNEKKNLAHHNEGLLFSDLITILFNNLKPNGTFFLLLPYKRLEEIRNMMTSFKLSIQSITLVKQTPDHNFFRVMLAGKLVSNKIVETKINELLINNKIIKGNVSPYSSEFKNLLKAYYLNK